MDGNFERRPIAWIVEKWFWGQHEFHTNQSISLSKFSVSLCQTLHVHISTAILKVTITVGHWYVHNDSRHLQFSGFDVFWSAPELSVSWLNWMSLPNKLKCSHTVLTLRCKGNLLCMNHKFVHVPCGVVRLEWERRRDTLLILRLSVSHVQILFFFFSLFSF